MWFGSQAVLIWFYLSSWSFVYFGSQPFGKGLGCFILAQGGVRVLERKLTFLCPCIAVVGLPSSRPSLHLAACPVIDADHLGQALPGAVSVVLKTERERCPFLWKSSLLGGAGLLPTACHASLQHSVQVTRRSRDSGYVFLTKGGWPSVDT